MRTAILPAVFVAAVTLGLALARLEAKTIYVAVSNPDMSFLSGDEIIDFSLVREVLKEMGESPSQ